MVKFGIIAATSASVALAKDPIAAKRFFKPGKARGAAEQEPQYQAKQNQQYAQQQPRKPLGRRGDEPYRYQDAADVQVEDENDDHQFGHQGDEHGEDYGEHGDFDFNKILGDMDFSKLADSFYNQDGQLKKDFSDTFQNFDIGNILTNMPHLMEPEEEKPVCEHKPLCTAGAQNGIISHVAVQGNLQFDLPSIDMDEITGKLIDEIMNDHTEEVSVTAAEVLDKLKDAEDGEHFHFVGGAHEGRNVNSFTLMSNGRAIHGPEKFTTIDDLARGVNQMDPETVTLLLAPHGVHKDIIPPQVHELIKSMNPGLNKCLHSAERQLRVVHANFERHSDIVHDIHHGYSKCNLDLCEQYCGEGTGNEKFMQMCKVGSNILLQDLHLSHHQEVHGQDEYIMDKNAEFSCGNFRYWQEKHMLCVPVQNVTATFYESLNGFAKNAGYADEYSQTEEVSRICNQIKYDNNLPADIDVLIENNADFRANCTSLFFEYHENADLHNQVAHFGISGPKWEEFSHTVKSYILGPTHMMHDTLQKMKTGDFKSDMDDMMKGKMGGENGGKGFGDMFGDMFGGAKDGKGPDMNEMMKSMQGMFGGNGKGGKMPDFDFNKMFENMNMPGGDDVAAEL